MAEKGCCAPKGAVASGRNSEPQMKENNMTSEAKSFSARAAGQDNFTSMEEACEAAASPLLLDRQTVEEVVAEGESSAVGKSAESEGRSATGPANGKPLNSVLRSSIARYGSNSYYYAHAGLPGAAEDATTIIKVTEAPGVVTGGPPILLGRSAAGGDGTGAAAPASDAQRLSAAEAAAAAVAGKRLSGFTVLQSYMWTDDGAHVSAYIQLEKLPETPEEKEAESSFDAKTAAAYFDEECAALVIHRKAKKYLLNLNKLYFPIKPSESRALIKKDKIILRLVKEDENLTWFSLMKNR